MHCKNLTYVVIAQGLDQLRLNQVDLIFEVEEDEDDAADVSAEEDEQDDDERAEHAAVLAGRAAAAQEREQRQEAEHDDEDLEREERLGSGGGTSGRAMTFCLDRPGSNPGTDLGFYSSENVVNLFSLGAGLFLMTCYRTVHTLPSSNLFPFIIYYCKFYIL